MMIKWQKILTNKTGFNHNSFIKFKIYKDKIVTTFYL